eukprot:6246117-Amphidinium_carterae.1
MEDFRGNLEADVVANLGAAEHVPHEPTADWVHWELVAKSVRHFWLMVGPKLRERPEACPASDTCFRAGRSLGVADGNAA